MSDMEADVWLESVDKLSATLLVNSWSLGYGHLNAEKLLAMAPFFI